MKFRVALVLLTFASSFLIPADRVSNNWPGGWSASSVAVDFVKGLGVNIHFTDPRPGEVDMIADAGFRWVRMDLKWDATEPRKGHYDFAAYDRLVASIEQRRIHALLILDYANPIYDKGGPPRTAEARRAFASWAVTAAKHFAGRGVIWEMYNEPNNRMFWPPRPNVDEYIALALEVARAFRAELPNEKLIGPATSGIDFQFLESCFKAGLLNYWSAVSVHPYRHSGPEAAVREYSKLRRLIQKYTAPRSGLISIIASEWGYSSAWTGVTEQMQSAIYAREMLTNIANGIPLSIWYDWRDDGLDATEPEHHFGLVRNRLRTSRVEPYEPKPVYFAAKTVNMLVDGYVFEKRVPLGSDADYVLAFRKGGSLRYAVWTTSTPHKILFPVSSQSAQLITHLGVTHLIPIQQSAIELSSAPIFIVP